jgi:hypothetical protein
MPKNVDVTEIIEDVAILDCDTNTEERNNQTCGFMVARNGAVKEPSPELIEPLLDESGNEKEVKNIRDVEAEGSMVAEASLLNPVGKPIYERVSLRFAEPKYCFVFEETDEEGRYHWLSCINPNSPKIPMLKKAYNNYKKQKSK